MFDSEQEEGRTGLAAEIAVVLRRQREFYRTGATKDPDFRLGALQRLQEGINARQGELAEAVRVDLGKSRAEFFMTEVGLVLAEIREHRRRLARWMRPKKVSTSILHFLGRSYVVPEPYGQCLIISPWNYPMNLTFTPLVGALSAGNTAIVKPSSRVPNISGAMASLIRECFPPEHVSVFTGSVDVSEALLEERFDLIFFTGSTSAGRKVMRKAAEHLTPVVLELGGKSPCIVHKDADIRVAARRIAWGKFLNAGQTCTAPDYLLVHSEVKEPLIEALAAEVLRCFGPEPKESKEFPRIVSARHVERLARLMSGAGRVRFLGEVDVDQRYVAPTVIDDVDPAHPIMQEEVFGPVLPVIAYDELEKAFSIIRERPKPLALYLFSRDHALKERVLNELPSGGFMFNDTLVHFASCTLPFGGVGESGMGMYHGRYSFDAFSHQRAVMERSTAIDVPVRYYPLKRKLWLLRLFYRLADYLKW